MSKTQRVVFVLLGLFTIAILINVFLTRENFFTGYTVTSTTTIKDDQGNIVNSSGVDAKGNPSVPPSVPSSGSSKNSYDASGNTQNSFSDLIQKLLGQTPSSANFGIRNKKYDASGNSLDWHKDVEEIKNILSTLKTNTVKDVQNSDVAAYNLDQEAQQACGKPKPKPEPEPPSPCLEQGQYYTGTCNQEPECPYAQAQQMAKQAQPNPIDMNDYIRKDSIPCYGCNIK